MGDPGVERDSGVAAGSLSPPPLTPPTHPGRESRSPTAPTAFRQELRPCPRPGGHKELDGVVARTEVRAAGTELGEAQAGDPGGRQRGASLVF